MYLNNNKKEAVAHKNKLKVQVGKKKHTNYSRYTLVFGVLN